MIRSIAALACLLVVVSCTSSGDSGDGAPSPPEPTSIVVVDARSGLEATSTAAIAANPMLERFDCANHDRWKGGQDLQISFEPEADRAAIDGLLAVLNQSDQVVRSAYFDQATTFDEINESYTQRHNQPMSLSIDEIPSRSSLVIAAPVDENIATLISLHQDNPLVFAFAERPAFCTETRDDLAVLCAELALPRRAILFIKMSVPDSDIRRLGEVLGAVDDFESITFVSQEQARTELERTLDEVTPFDLAWLDRTLSQWRFEVPLDTDVTAVFDELRQDPSVDDVHVASSCEPTDW